MLTQLKEAKSAQTKTSSDKPCNLTGSCQCNAYTSNDKTYIVVFKKKVFLHLITLALLRY